MVQAKFAAVGMGRDENSNIEERNLRKSLSLPISRVIVTRNHVSHERDERDESIADKVLLNKDPRSIVAVDVGVDVDEEGTGTGRGIEIQVPALGIELKRVDTRALKDEEDSDFMKFARNSFSSDAVPTQSSSTLLVGQYIDSMQDVGFGELQILGNFHSRNSRDSHTRPTMTMEMEEIMLKHYAAGLAEGFMTKEETLNLVKNDMQLRNEFLDETVEYMKETLHTAKQFAIQTSKASAPEAKPVENRILYTMLRLQGIVDAIRALCNDDKAKTGDDTIDLMLGLWILNNDPDVVEVEQKFALMSTNDHSDRDNDNNDGDGGDDDDDDESIHADLLTLQDSSTKRLLSMGTKRNKEKRSRRRREGREGERGRRNMGRKSLEETGGQNSHVRNIASMIRNRNGLKHGQTNNVQLAEMLELQAKCSMLVRMTDIDTEGIKGAKEIIVGHTTWENYLEFVRIFKHISLDGGEETVSFSSYPGMVISTDDWYIISSQHLREKFNVTARFAGETSLNVIDSEPLMKLNSSQGLPSWLRAFAVSMEASSPLDWSKKYSKHENGAGAAQWIILDMYNSSNSSTTSRTSSSSNNSSSNDGVANNILPAFTLGVHEVAAFTHEYQDMTNYLKKNGFFSGQNSMLFNATRTAAGYRTNVNVNVNANVNGKQSIDEQHCYDLYSYNNNPRGCIFQRDAPQVGNLEDMRKLIRSNNYKTDALSRGKPNYAIASRYDLLPTGSSNRKPQGSVDGKVTSATMMQTTMCTQLDAGPVVTEQCPPFTWNAYLSSSNNENNYHPYGMPLDQPLAFNWVLTCPLWRIHE